LVHTKRVFEPWSGDDSRGRDGAKEKGGIGIDLSYPGYSVDEIIAHVGTLVRSTTERVTKFLRDYAQKKPEALAEFLKKLGFGVTARRAMVERLVEHFT